MKTSEAPPISPVGQVHILTPFHRVENIPALIACLEPMRVTWHPICDLEVKFAAPWIIPVFAYPPSNWDFCYWKLNYWIQTQTIIDSDWYCFMNDDDGYESNVMDMIRSQTSSQVVVISMKRGHRTPQSEKHGTSTFVAAPENMRVCSVGLEQLFVRGSVLRTLRFVNYTCGDGLMVEHVTRRFATTYEPNCYAQFNLLQPGRWDTDLAKPPPPEPVRRLRDIRYILLRTWIGFMVWLRQARDRAAARKAAKNAQRVESGGENPSRKGTLGAG